MFCVRNMRILDLCD